MLSDAMIVSMDPRAMLSRDFLDEIYEIQDPEEQARVKALAMVQAKELGIQKEFAATIKAFNIVDQQIAADYTKANRERYADVELEYGSDGKPATSIDNFVRILEGDSHFAGLKFNLLTYSPEVEEDGKTRPWQDFDDSSAKRYIEEKYKIHQQQKFEDAMRIVFHKREYHPVRDLVRSIQWDGTPRVEGFLHKWAKCEDNAYTREVSRLIFAGCVHRTFHPGGKFDDMAVLVGKQGCGKSTLVRWLALEDRFFAEINDFEGQAAMEAIDGCAVAEVSELLALTKTKEREAVKAFLTRLNDRRRNPYDRRVTDHPRQAVFIGTSNREAFINDPTGGRRFYPVAVEQNGYELFDHEKECREDIRQCWAEAYAKMLEGKMPAYANRDLIPEIRKHQENATEEDYRVGMIQGYLEGKAAVCVLELWREALGNSEFTKPKPKESVEIGLIMQGMTGWVKQTGTRRFGAYGPQRYWLNEGGKLDESGLL